MTRADVITWPADRLFWAVLHGPSATSSLRHFARRTHQRELEYALEGELPLPLDAVHAVFVPLPDGRVLACAAACEDLHSLSEETSLTPSELPPWIQTDVEPASIELLTGPFTPRRVVVLRQRWAAASLAIVLLGLTFIIAGLEIRIDTVTAAQKRIHADADAVLVDAGFEGPREQARLQLLAGVRQLEQSATGQPSRSTFDSMLALSHVLEAWPEDADVSLVSMDASGRTIAITAAAPDATRAGALASALEVVWAEGNWRAQPPDVMRHRGGVRITIRSEREEEET